MIARVRALSFARTVSAVMFWLSRSTSAKTGVAPQSATLLADATKVRGVTITSSPRPMPSAWSAASRASVPLASATAYRASHSRANSRSNSWHSSVVQ